MVLPDPLGDSTTEAAAARSSDNGALIVKEKDESSRTTKERKKRKKESTQIKRTYADTVCGCFTVLRKRAAFAAASSCLVAATPPLGFFVRLPNKPWAARCF